MSEELFARLQRLTALDGVAGAEQPVARHMVVELGPLADRVEADPFGNVVAVRQGPPGGRSLLVVVHTDEVGCLVQGILPNGMLRVAPMGYVSLRSMPASRVRVGPRGIPGVVGTPPAHLDTGAGAGLLPFAALHVDVGADSAEQVRALGIGEGDPVAFDAPLIRLAEQRVTGKALDNRIGCAVLLELFSALAGTELPVTLLGAAVVQEEIGMRGARMVAERCRPDLAVAVDTVPADDTAPGGLSAPVRLGHGPVVQLAEGVMAAYVGTVHHPAIRRLIQGAAAALAQPLQYSVSTHWTTDAAQVHTSAGGIPTGFVSIPRRYAHSAGEVLDLADGAAAVRVLAEVVRRAGGVSLDFWDV